MLTLSITYTAIPTCCLEKDISAINVCLAQFPFITFWMEAVVTLCNLRLTTAGFKRTKTAGRVFSTYGVVLSLHTRNRCFSGGLQYARRLSSNKQQGGIISWNFHLEQKNEKEICLKFILLSSSRSPSSATLLQRHSYAAAASTRMTQVESNGFRHFLGQHLVSKAPQSLAALGWEAQELCIESEKK